MRPLASRDLSSVEMVFSYDVFPPSVKFSRTREDATALFSDSIEVLVQFLPRQTTRLRLVTGAIGTVHKSRLFERSTYDPEGGDWLKVDFFVDLIEYVVSSLAGHLMLTIPQTLAFN